MMQLDLLEWRPPPPPPSEPTPRLAVGPGRGVDLSKKALDVRRIVIKHFAVPGVPPDDLVSDVYVEICKMNSSAKCAFDPARASFGRYIYMVGRSVTIKVAKREQKQARIRAEYEKAGLVMEPDSYGDCEDDGMSFERKQGRWAEGVDRPGVVA
jgi:hypothetical protein